MYTKQIMKEVPIAPVRVIPIHVKVVQFITVLVMNTALWLYRACFISLLWQWFITPYTGIPAIPIVVAYCLVWISDTLYIRGARGTTADKEWGDDALMVVLWEVLFGGIEALWVSIWLVILWAVHTFVA